MSYRAVLIGCGKIGTEFADDARVKGIYSHAGAYAACSKTTLVAVCDSDPGKLERCGERWNVTARYQDAMQMLDEQRPDIVSICTPDASHYDLIKAAISVPGVRAVLAEKPLAVELESALDLLSLASERGVVLAVNYTRRYAINHIRLREFLKSGGIGTIQTIGGYYTKGTLHSGTHWFDLARFLVGEVAWVQGYDRRKEEGDDPTLDALLGFACGASAYLHACDATAFSIFEMDLIGTSGRVRIVESGHAIEVYHVVDSPHYSGYQTLAQKDRLEGGMEDVLLYAVQDVVRCLEEGGQPRCSGVDGVAALKIAFAVRNSAGDGRIVNLRRV